MTSFSADPLEARERALRRELQRIHRAEVSTARALEEIRAARTRVEELLAAAPAAHPAPVSGEAPEAPEAPEADEADEAARIAAAEQEDVVRTAAAVEGASSSSAPARRRRGLEAAVGVAVLALIGFFGWWAFQNVPGGGADALTPPPTTDPSPPVADADGAPGRDGASSGEAEGAGPGAGTESGPFDELPRGAEGSIALLDSLWAGPSPLLEPLLEEVEETTGSSAVEEGIESLRSGEEPGVLVRDLVRSAALQLGLRRITGEELSVDGQVLRNPCRGSSCGALLELWEDSASAWGLEPPGENASRDLTGLAAAEAAVVLRVLRDLHGG